MTLQSLKDRSLGVVVPLLLLFSWEFLTRYEIVATQVLVPPRQVYETFMQLLESGELNANLKVSLLRVGAGFVIGATAGFLLGAAMGIFRPVERYVGPIFHAARQIPLLGWLPLIILACGIGEVYKVVFIAIGSLYPLALKTFDGIKGVSHQYVEVARVFAFSRVRLLTTVLLPAALPSIISGLRLSLQMAWMSVIGAELVAASEGIGYMMVMGRQLFQMDVVMVGVIVIGVVGFLLNQIFVVLETRLLGWRRTFNTKQA